jgi:hypothetical protein
VTPLAKIFTLPQQQPDALAEIMSELKAQREMLEQLLAKEPPLYALADEAARISGFGRDVIKEHLARSHEPLPHVPVGNRKYIKVAEIEPYFHKFEIR